MTPAIASTITSPRDADSSRVTGQHSKSNNVDHSEDNDECIPLPVVAIDHLRALVRPDQMMNVGIPLAGLQVGGGMMDDFPFRIDKNDPIFKEGDIFSTISGNMMNSLSNQVMCEDPQRTVDSTSTSPTGSRTTLAAMDKAIVPNTRSMVTNAYNEDSLNVSSADDTSGSFHQPDTDVQSTLPLPLPETSIVGFETTQVLNSRSGETTISSPRNSHSPDDGSSANQNQADCITVDQLGRPTESLAIEELPLTERHIPSKFDRIILDSLSHSEPSGSSNVDKVSQMELDVMDTDQVEHLDLAITAVEERELMGQLDHSIRRAELREGRAKKARKRCVLLDDELHQMDCLRSQSFQLRRLRSRGTLATDKAPVIESVTRLLSCSFPGVIEPFFLFSDLEKDILSPFSRRIADATFSANVQECYGHPNLFQLSVQGRDQSVKYFLHKVDTWVLQRQQSISKGMTLDGDATVDKNEKSDDCGHDVLGFKYDHHKPHHKRKTVTFAVDESDRSETTSLYESNELERRTETKDEQFFSLTTTSNEASEEKKMPWSNELEEAVQNGSISEVLKFLSLDNALADVHCSQLESLRTWLKVQIKNSRSTLAITDLSRKDKILNIFVNAYYTINDARYLMSWERFEIQVKAIRNVQFTADEAKSKLYRITAEVRSIHGTEQEKLSDLPTTPLVDSEVVYEDSHSYHMKYNVYTAPDRNLVVKLFLKNGIDRASIGSVQVEMSKVHESCCALNTWYPIDIPFKPRGCLASACLSVNVRRVEYEREPTDICRRLRTLVDWIERFNNDMGNDGSFTTDVRVFDNISLLHAAVFISDLELVQLLLDRGADFFSRSKIGSAITLATAMAKDSPLSQAGSFSSSSSRKDIVRYLNAHARFMNTRKDNNVQPILPSQPLGRVAQRSNEAFSKHHDAYAATGAKLPESLSKTSRPVKSCRFHSPKKWCTRPDCHFIHEIGPFGESLPQLWRNHQDNIRQMKERYLSNSTTVMSRMVCQNQQDANGGTWVSASYHSDRDFSSTGKFVCSAEGGVLGRVDSSGTTWYPDVHDARDALIEVAALAHVLFPIKQDVASEPQEELMRQLNRKRNADSMNTV